MDIPETDTRPADPALEGLVPSTPAVFHILLALVAGASHGYGIMQEVERLTSGRVRLGNATLYRSLQKMAVDGLVEEFSDPQAHADERRREYRLTHLGTRVARAEARRMSELTSVSRRLGLLGPTASRGRTGARRRIPKESQR